MPKTWYNNHHAAHSRTKAVSDPTSNITFPGHRKSSSATQAYGELYCKSSVISNFNTDQKTSFEVGYHLVWVTLPCSRSWTLVITTYRVTFLERFSTSPLHWQNVYYPTTIYMAQYRQRSVILNNSFHCISHPTNFLGKFLVLWVNVKSCRSSKWTRIFSLGPFHYLWAIWRA